MIRRFHVIRMIFSILAFLSVATALHSQASYVIVDSVRLPAESYVGDPVELRYTIRTEGSVSIPEEVPQPRWGEIDLVRVIPGPGRFDLRLTVTPYQPGTVTLPRLQLGDVRLDGLSIIVQSILGQGDTDLRPALGPQRLPGTRVALLLIALGGSFVTALVIYLAGPGRKHIKALVNRYRAAAPHRHLVSRMNHLEREIRQYSIREFYIELCHEIQVFMTSRTPGNCLAATSSELIEALPVLETQCGAQPGSAAPLEQVIRASDAVKFQKQSIRQKKRLHHLKLVHAVANELEASRRKLGRTSRRAARPMTDHRKPTRVGV